ncbi:MAG: ribose 5-phosphate isomerase A [Phycisphaerales bacterium]|nr:ribose 5-phosphate isomerase A [Phycisphaerales bacterium]
MSTPAPDPASDALANAAVALIKPRSIVGLGTGRAAARAVRTLALRNQRENLDLTCVSTSNATELLARSLNLRVVPLNDVSRIDLLFDGADEVDPALHMIKGGGAAMTRERIVAHACLQSGGSTIYLIDDSKLSNHLGEKRLLPIEIIPLARVSVLRDLAQLGLVPSPNHPDPLRRTQSSLGSAPNPLAEPTITDNAGHVLDLPIPANIARSPAALKNLAQTIRQIPGIIDHGLFITECQTLATEDPTGKVHITTRRA